MQNDEKNEPGNPDLLVVAVVIPCHNHAEYVKRAIISAAKQDYPAKIIVVVDDGSTDDSHTVVRSLLTDQKQEKDGIVGRLIDYPVGLLLLRNEKPTGPSAARNKAIQAVANQAHLFAMLDADDEYRENKISLSVLPFLESPESVGLTYTDAIIRNENTGTEVHEFRQPYSMQALRQECIISNTPLISRLAIQDAGMYDETMRTAEDWDLWLRITARFIAVHIPLPLHYYSVTGRNASDIVPKEVWQKNWAKIRERVLQRDQ